jgi:hypothetical protein
VSAWLTDHADEHRRPGPALNAANAVVPQD